jgi:hypothetical protein
MHWWRLEQVGRWEYDKVHLRDGGDESGRTMVAVVGTGGYKNEAQEQTGEHWAKVYSTGCQQARQTSVTYRVVGTGVYKNKAQGADGRAPAQSVLHRVPSITCR